MFVNGHLSTAAAIANFGTAARPRHRRLGAQRPCGAQHRNAQDGARIEIPAGTVVDGLIHLLFIGRGDGIWSHPRNVIVAGSNSQVTIVETYVGSGGYFTNAVTEIVAGDGAVIDHYRLECESLTAYHVGNVYIRQDRASSVTSRNIAIGGALARDGNARRH